MNRNRPYVLFLVLSAALAARAARSPDGQLAVERLADGTTLVRYDDKEAVRIAGVGAAAETRLFDAGFAWREPGAAEYAYDFAEDARCWPVSHAQGKYLPLTLAHLGEQAPIPGFAPVAAGFGKMFNYDQKYLRPGSCEAPLVVEKSNGLVIALGDAAVYGGARLRFEKGAKAGTVTSYLEGPDAAAAPSWKYVRVAASPAALYNGNAMVESLCRPCADPALVALGAKGPGKVLRVAKLTTEVSCQAVDFVKAHHMQYIELDAGWYGQEQTGDPLKPGLAPEKLARGERLDLPAVLAYAKAKGVGVILYVNRLPLIRNYAAILDQFKAWGVAGVKYGFLGVGSAKERAFSFTLIEEAAKRGLLVDIHDEMRLTGEERTFPNVMTVEGIHGNEEMPTADHNAALVFTRYLTGPGDYTPCWRIARLKTTLAHQLALPLCYESKWQFLYWYSKPSDVKGESALALWDELPTVFDETRALAGEIGEFAVVARRKGDTWYVGALNGLARRTIAFDTAFLGAGEWECRLYRDKEAALTQGLGEVAIETVRVGPRLAVDTAARGGFAAVFTRRSAPQKGVAAADRLDAFLAEGERALADRLCMYWQSHATNVYVRDERVVGVGGDAGLPTVMFAGARSHVTKRPRPKLEEVPLRNEDYLKPWGESGTIVESLNKETLGLALAAAERWAKGRGCGGDASATGDERYARLAYNVLDTYLEGILARNVATDLNHAHAQTLFGLQSHETIHDNVLEPLCPLYAALKPYVAAHHPEKLPRFQAALRKWAEVQIANGVADNNWDMMQLNYILNIALVLDEPDRSHYIDVVFNASSVRNLGIKALAAKGFDPETGIWWECPGYSVGVTVNDFMKFAERAKEALGVDLFAEIPVLQKACDAAGEYLFPDGLLMGFGDTHPSPIPPLVLKHAKNLHSSPFFYAPNASWLVARSGMDATNDVAFALNASLGNHQHANGISLELYAKGYRLAPDAGIGWSLYSGDDYKEYYSRFPAHNTVMVNSRSNYGAMKAYQPFTLLGHGETWATVGFREPATNAEQQRTVRYVKDEDGAYFIDVFRSRIPHDSSIRQFANSPISPEWHDYYYHNLGESLALNGEVAPTDIVNFGESGLYALSYIQDKFARVGTNDLVATFAWARPEGNVGMRVFMNGGEGRTFVKALAPATEGLSRVKRPNYGITRDSRTPVLVVRQQGEAWNHPFLAVMDPCGTVASVAFAPDEIRVRRTSGKVDVVKF